MKLAAFAFIVGLCLVAVTANVSGNTEPEYDEIKEYDYIAQELAEEIMEIDSQSSLYFVLKNALRSLKGLNCIIKEAIVIRGAANDFVTNVAACGGEVSKKVQSVIKACNDIIDTCKAILGINESVCSNTANEDQPQTRTWNVVSGAQNAHKCFVQMLRKFQTLTKQIKSAKKLIKQIKKVPGDTSQCVLDPVNTLENYFIQFPSNIKTCSKLVNNKSIV